MIPRKRRNTRVTVDHNGDVENAIGTSNNIINQAKKREDDPFNKSERSKNCLQFNPKVVFPEDFHKLGRTFTLLILDPQSEIVSQWNKIFLSACLCSLFIDPLFLLSPYSSADELCVEGGSASMDRVLTIMRSLCDMFYIVNVCVQFRTAYVAPSSRVLGRGELVIDPWKIASKYLARDFWFDALAVLPFPQAAGASWYLLALERQVDCWRSECHQETPTCQYSFFACRTINEPERTAWLANTNVTSICNPSNTFFQYGIYQIALQAGAPSSNFVRKFFYSFWWGLQSLSSIGNNLWTSNNVVENIFTNLVAILGLILFALLVGNIQRYLDSTSVRLEEWRTTRTDTEEWMHHRMLPPYLRHWVRKYHQYKWVATRGVNEEALVNDLPTNLRRQINRHLCFNLLRQVATFEEMDDHMLDAICERLKPALCIKGAYLSREGDPVNKMFFIIRGNLDSYTTNGGRVGFFNSSSIGPGNFCGEELLTWALGPNPSPVLPLSTRTVKAISDVEAFCLMPEDLKYVGTQFKKLMHNFRFHSHPWRTWAACYIQAAWQRHRERKESAQYHSVPQEIDINGPQPRLDLAISAARHVRRGSSNQFGPDSSSSEDLVKYD
ncbi:hypothetical protein Ancab_010694 [Ancistrocladus abbreviatus]